MQSDTIVETLSRVPLLVTLCPDEIRLLATTARRRDYKAGAPIVLQGDVSASMFVIVEGHAKVHIATESGSDVILSVLGPNDCFGEIAFIDGLPRSAAVSALEDTRTIELTSRSLHETVLSSPDLAWSLLRALAMRLRQQNSTVETLVTKDVGGRIADLLLRLDRTHGKPCKVGKSLCLEAEEESPTVIVLTLSQTEIGRFIGATRERVSKVMNAMKKDKILDKESRTGHIVILNHSKLRRMLEIG